MVILLEILKIIGFILLIILGIVLFLILVILFVPIRYKINGYKGDEDQDYFAIVNISWILHIIHVSISFKDKQLSKVIRIFGFRYNKGESEEKRRTKSKNDSEDKSEKNNGGNDISCDSIEVVNEELSDEVTYTLYNFDNDNPSENTNNSSLTDKKPELEENDSNSCTETVHRNDFSDSITVDDFDNDYNVSSSSQAEDDLKQIDLNDDDLKDDNNKFAKKLEEFSKWLISLYNKVINLFSKTANNIDESINNVSKEIDFYKRFIEDERNQKAIAVFWHEVVRILKALNPKKIKGDIHFGFDDPSTTGQVLSYISMFFPLIYKKISVYPDFDNKIMKGKILIKGRITIFVLVVALWNVYFNKDIKRFLRIYKKHKNKSGVKDK